MKKYYLPILAFLLGVIVLDYSGCVQADGIHLRNIHITN
jgi:hypothetical protein